jgi:hypothetical protein
MSQGRPPGSMEASERGKGTTDLPPYRSPDGKRFPILIGYIYGVLNPGADKPVIWTIVSCGRIDEYVRIQ